MSALRSSAGPAVCTKRTPSSSATMRASEVLPSPGGPASSTWSSGSLRAAAAPIETASWAFTACCPTNSSSRRGRSRGSRSSSGRSCGVCTRSSAITPGVRIGSLTAACPSARARSGPRACRPARRRAARRPPGPRSRARPAPRAQARAGRRPRWIVIGAASSAGPTFSRSSTTIRSAVRRPIPGTAWSRAVSPAATAPSRSRGEPPERTAWATFGPTPWTPISRRNRSRSSSVAKP